MHAFDLKKNLSLIYLIICGMLTVATVVFSFYVYVSWSEPVPQDPEILQIKLPVMKWAEYSTLSKRYENGIITEESDSVAKKVKAGLGLTPEDEAEADTEFPGTGTEN